MNVILQVVIAAKKGNMLQCSPKNCSSASRGLLGGRMEGGVVSHSEAAALNLIHYEGIHTGERPIRCLWMDREKDF